MSVKRWEKKVLEARGAAKRVAELEEEMRLAVRLTALREQAGLSQRDLAKRLGVSQPRVAAIEQARNVTIDVLDQYVKAVGGELEVNVVKDRRKHALIAPHAVPAKAKAQRVVVKKAARRPVAKRAARRKAG